MLELFVIITIILCTVILFLGMKNRKEQQKETIKLKEEMALLLIDKLNENNQKKFGRK